MVFSVGDTELYYKVMGQGPPVLMLHGWGGCADSFAPVSLRLANLFSVYAIDFPGHGQSSMPQRPWKVQDYAGVVRAFIKEMGLEGCYVCLLYTSRPGICLVEWPDVLEGWKW